MFLGSVVNTSDDDKSWEQVLVFEAVGHNLLGFLDQFGLALVDELVQVIHHYGIRVGGFGDDEVQEDDASQNDHNHPNYEEENVFTCAQVVRGAKVEISHCDSQGREQVSKEQPD